MTAASLHLCYLDIPISMALFMCILHPAISFFSIISFAMVISFMPILFFSPAAILSMSALAFVILASVQSISAAAAGAIESSGILRRFRE